MIKLIQLNEDLEHLSDTLKDKAVVALDDTQAQVALEYDGRVEEVKEETKPVVDSTKEVAKETNSDGKVREIFYEGKKKVRPTRKIKESVMDSPREEDITEIRPETPEEFGITSAITELIKKGWDNIDLVNSYLSTFGNEVDGMTKEVLQDIVDDNMIHITKLEGCLK